MAHNVRGKINFTEGTLTLANPKADPRSSRIIGVDNVPDEVTPAQALQQMEKIVFWPSQGGIMKPVLAEWSEIASLEEGTIYRY